MVSKLALGSLMIQKERNTREPSGFKSRRRHHGLNFLTRSIANVHMSCNVFAGTGRDRPGFFPANQNFNLLTTGKSLSIL